MQSHRAERVSYKILDFFKLRAIENALIIASGPSSTHWAQQQKTTVLSLCVIARYKNADLTEHFQPKALVFGDPIFHFGLSSYVANFRAQLMSSAQNFSYKIFIPLKFYDFFCTFSSHERPRNWRSI